MRSKLSDFPYLCTAWDSRWNDDLVTVVCKGLKEAATGAWLVFVPNRIRELGSASGADVMVPLRVAAPLLLTSLAVAALSYSGLVRGIFWVSTCVAAGSHGTVMRHPGGRAPTAWRVASPGQAACPGAQL